MQKKISIIVPVYNTETEYLKKCIESVLSQDYENFELILVNDGSANLAPEICERYSDRDSRIVYLDQDNKGVSVARNNGLDHATGDLVMFLDADDFISKDALACLVAEYDRYLKSGVELDILFFGYCTSYTNREMVRVMKDVDQSIFNSKKLQLAILQGDPDLGIIEVGAPWCKLIKRSVIENNGVRFIEGVRKGQDTLFTLYLLEHCENMAYTPVAGYHYRMSGASISHRYNEAIIEILERTLSEYKRFVDTYNPDELFITALNKKHYRILMNEYLELYFFHRNNPNKISYILKELKALIAREPYATVLKNISCDNMNMLQRMELFFVRKRLFLLLMFYKKLMYFAKGMIVKNYS